MNYIFYQLAWNRHCLIFLPGHDKEKYKWRVTKLFICQGRSQWQSAA